MSLSPREISKLRQIVALAETMLSTADQPATVASKKRSTIIASRTRRTGKELVAFRKMLKAERKRGVSVMEMAQKHGISPAYIYQQG